MSGKRTGSSKDSRKRGKKPRTPSPMSISDSKSQKGASVEKIDPVEKKRSYSIHSDSEEVVIRKRASKKESKMDEEPPAKERAPSETERAHNPRKLSSEDLKRIATEAAQIDLKYDRKYLNPTGIFGRFAARHPNKIMAMTGKFSF